MEELKNRNDYAKAMQLDGVAVLGGYTTWCPQCKAVAPKIQELKKKYPDARFYRYNIEVAEDIAQELGVRHVPSFAVFVDGFVQDGVTGAQAGGALEKLIKENYQGTVVE